MRKLFIFTILTLSLVLTGCIRQVVKENPDEVNSTQLANPASVYCEEQGGELEMRTEEAGVYGVCKFSDGSECEEWAFFRNECEQADIEQVEDDVDNDEVVADDDEVTVEKGTSTDSADSQQASSPQQDSGQAVQGNDKIKVFNIEDNQTVFSPLTITGQGVAFENNLIIELRNKDHETMVKEFTTIKSGEVGVIGDYSITLNFEFSNTKEGYVAVYEQSAKDGSELNLVEIPVEFSDLDTSN